MTGRSLAGAIIGLMSLSSPSECQVLQGRLPETYTYREIDGRPLAAYVFSPVGHGRGSKSNGILLFHGGGWTAGSPEWTFEAARRFARAGLVAVAVEYRLSGEEATPIEALADACAAFEWARRQADELGLTDRIAGYGVSAGGHLVASTATVGCPGETDGAGYGPEALLLWSPALDVSGDGWFRRLLQGRAEVAELSPVEHVRPWTPPTSIVQGEKDTLTPVSGARRYCRLIIQEGGTCELNVYPGVGHLLTRNLESQEGDFDPDPAAVADGIAKHLAFLQRLDLTVKR